MSFHPEDDKFYFELADKTVQVVNDNFEACKSGEMTLRDAAWYPVAEALDMTAENQEEHRQYAEYCIDMVLSILDNK